MSFHVSSARSPLERSVVALSAALSLAAFAAPALASVPIVATTSSKMATSQDGSHNPEVFTISADGHEHQLSWAGSWSATDIFSFTNSVAAPTNTAIASLQTPPTISYYLGADGHVHQTLKPSAWTDRDLTAQAGGAVAVAGSSLSTIYMPDGGSRIYYVTTTGHIEELAVSAGGGSASSTDVTVASGAPLPASGSAMTSFASSGEPRVYYFTSDGHVQELEFGTGGWHHSDITVASGGPLAVSGSALTGIAGGASPKVYFLTAAGHVQEFGYLSGWHSTDTTATANATPAVAGSSLTSEFINGGYPRVYFTSYDGHVRELAVGNDTWIQTDLTARTNAPLAAAGSALASNYRTSDGVLWVFYISANNHVQEFAWTGGWSHNDINQ